MIIVAEPDAQPEDVHRPSRLLSPGCTVTPEGEPGQALMGLASAGPGVSAALGEN